MKSHLTMVVFKFAGLDQLLEKYTTQQDFLFHSKVDLVLLLLPQTEPEKQNRAEGKSKLNWREMSKNQQSQGKWEKEEVVIDIVGAGSLHLTFWWVEKQTILTTFHWESMTSHTHWAAFSSSSSTVFFRCWIRQRSDGCYQVLQPLLITSEQR